MTIRGEAPGAWHLRAQLGSGPPAADWREELAHMLGYRPRRLGEWTELALHGALRCLRAAGETQLPAGARLRVASRSGPASAQREALRQFEEGLPMPFAFIQSQPAITLAVLAQALQWQGDAAFLVAPEASTLTSLCLQGAPSQGLLLGVIDIGSDGLSSCWQRWTR